MQKSHDMNTPCRGAAMQRPSASSPVETRDLGLGTRIPRAIMLIIFLLTIIVFTSAFFPHADAIATPALLDIVQRYNIDNPTAELMATLRMPAPKDPQSFVTSIANRLGCGDPLVVSAKETRLTAASPHGYTLSVRLHPVASMWHEQVELQISLVSVHPGVLTDTERQLRDLVHQFRPGDKTVVPITISGTLPSDRVDRTTKDLIARAFASLGAKISEGMSDENLESWSGVAARLPDQVVVGRNKLNLQMAARYASDAKTVIIKIGSPLIIGTY